MKRSVIPISVVLGLCGCAESVTTEWAFDLGAASVSTPLVEEQFVAVGSERGLTIVEVNGVERCSFDTKGEVIGQPAFANGRLYVGSTNYMLYAIDTKCQEQWKFPTGDRIKSDPLVVGGKVITSSYDGHVYALSTETGETIWTFPDATAAAPVAAAAAEDPAKLTPAEKKKRRRAKKRARRRKRRRARKQRQAKGPKPPAAEAPAEPGDAKKPVEQPKSVGDFSYSSPALADGVVYIGNLDHHLYALDFETGKMKWRFKTLGPVTSSPVVKDGVVYFGSNDGGVYAVEIASQKEVWRQRTEDWVNSSPRIVGKTLYIGSNDRHVYAVELSGNMVWKSELDGPAVSVPAVVQDMIVAAGSSGDGSIYLLNRQDGSRLWKFSTEGKVDSDPVVKGDHIYITSTDGYLYRFAVVQAPAG